MKILGFKPRMSDYPTSQTDQKNFMKKNFFFLIVIAILFSSCYRKMYYGCVEERSKLTNVHDLLLSEDSILTPSQITISRQYDSQKNILSNLSAQNIQLKAENERLKKLAIIETGMVRDCIVRYFERICTESNNHNPPCVNAANGWWREAIISPDINHLANPNLTLTTSAAAKLYTAFINFSKGNQGAFAGNGNYLPPYAVRLRMVVFDYGLTVLNIINNLRMGIDNNDNGAYAEAAKSAAGLYEKVKNSGKCYNGRHMHGNISNSVRAASINASFMVRQIANIDPNTNEGKMKQILELCFQRLAQLPTDHHDPWLNGSWQVGYYGILYVTTKQLKELKIPIQN